MVLIYCSDWSLNSQLSDEHICIVHICISFGSFRGIIYVPVYMYNGVPSFNIGIFSALQHPVIYTTVLLIYWIIFLNIPFPGIFMLYLLQFVLRERQWYHRLQFGVSLRCDYPKPVLHRIWSGCIVSQSWTLRSIFLSIFSMVCSKNRWPFLFSPFNLPFWFWN